MASRTSPEIGRPSTWATIPSRSASSRSSLRRMFLVSAMISVYQPPVACVLLLAQALPPRRLLAVAVDAELGHDPGTGGVDDLLGLVEQLGGTVAQAGRLGRRRGGQQVAVGPVDVGQA